MIWIRTSFLVYYNSEADIALFKLSVEAPDAEHSIGWDQLLTIDGFLRPCRIFTAGYNGEIEGGFVDATREYILMLSEQDQTNLIQNGQIMADLTILCGYLPEISYKLLPVRIVYVGCVLL